MAGDDTTRIAAALRGETIYGDDFTEAEIAEWLRDEKEAFTDLYVRQASYSYEYHALNQWHGYRHLPKKRYRKALGLGSATGDEFLPIIEQIEELVIVEPSDHYSDVKEIHGVPASYAHPRPLGGLEFPDGEFELINVMGVLHHIPNVSHVIKECSRCLSSNGWMIIREPIISMGRWEYPRPGLTARERGIPLGIMRERFAEFGLDCVHWSPWAFAPFARLARSFQIPIYNNQVLVRIDALFSRLFLRNYCYHATTEWKKVRPSAAFYVLKKAA